MITTTLLCAVLFACACLNTPVTMAANTTQAEEVITTEVQMVMATNHADQGNVAFREAMVSTGIPIMFGVVFVPLLLLVCWKKVFHPNRNTQKQNAEVPALEVEKVQLKVIEDQSGSGAAAENKYSTPPYSTPIYSTPDGGVSTTFENMSDVEDPARRSSTQVSN